MTTVKQVCSFLDSFAPTRLAEDWDNVGLLAGDPSETVARIMTCLTITPESAAEAVASNANMIVAHHPLPFKPMKRITTEQTGSRLIWNLIRAGVSIYSPHTGFDSASKGINQSLAQKLGLEDVQPLNSFPNDPQSLGSGRFGTLPAKTSLADFLAMTKATFELDTIQFVGHRNEQGELVNNVHKVAVACGSGGSFMERAIRVGCDTFVTGETNFHTALEASARGVSLVLLGHFSSERFAVEALATRMASEFSDVEVWASKKESDPLFWA